MEMRIVTNEPTNKLHRAYELEVLIKQALVGINNQVTELRELGHEVIIGLENEEKDFFLADDTGARFGVIVELRPVVEDTKLAS